VVLVAPDDGVAGLELRDPGAFDRLTRSIEAARAEKEAAELRWLELAEMVEALG